MNVQDTDCSRVMLFAVSLCGHKNNIFSIGSCPETLSISNNKSTTTCSGRNIIRLDNKIYRFHQMTLSYQSNTFTIVHMQMFCGKKNATDVIWSLCISTHFRIFIIYRIELIYRYNKCFDVFVSLFLFRYSFFLFLFSCWYWLTPILWFSFNVCL